MPVTARSWSLLPTHAYATAFVAQMFALTWTVSGGNVAIQLALFDHESASEGPLWVVSIGALVAGIVLFVLHRRVPPALFAPGMGMGVAIISVAIALAGGGRLASTFILYYVWVATFAFVFFPIGTAVGVSGLALVGYVTATAWIGPVPVSSSLTLGATLAIVGVVVDGLHRTRSASEVDGVTGAANMLGLERRLQREVERAADGVTLTVAVLDLDGFARINQVKGPLAGDRFLAELAEVWRGELADGDLLARVRGDRFAVITSRQTREGALSAVERLREAIPGPITCSAGVALYQPDDTPGMLVRRAEAAVHTAKEAGRNRVVVDGDDPTAVHDLRLGIERGQMTLVAQPIVNAATGRIRGFEALVRWQHPERGLLGPDAFIGVAEQTGLIVPLGSSVLDQACSHARRWLDAFPDEQLTIAVNVSGRQLDDEGFVEAVSSALDRHGLPADRLVIEVTESTLADDLGVWRERVAAIQRLGISISMDDFGTGYSSLGQLRQLPFATVKIDRSFVSDLPESSEADAVIAAVAAMARGLGKKTVAEGVETVEQLLRLRQHGCDEAQGYLFGRPVPIADAEAVVRQQATTQRLVRAVAAAESFRIDRPTDPQRPAIRRERSAWLDEAVSSLLRHLLDVGDVDSAYLSSIDWEQVRQLILVSENVGDLEIAEGVAIAWADTVCRRALEEGVSHTDDAQQRFPDSPAAVELEIGGYATEPVVLSDGTTFGTLCVANRRKGDVSEEVRALLPVYSRLIAERISLHVD